MSNKIFLSVATSKNSIHEEYERKLTKLFHNNGFELVKLQNWNDKNPLKPIHELLTKCSGCVVLLLERYYIKNGIARRNSAKEEELNNLALTTPWCHIEAGMAYTLGLPLLILRETSVYQDGLFDDKIETFDQVEIDINNFAELEHKNLKYILKKFFIEVNNIHFPTSKSELDSKSVETGSKKSIKIFISYSSKDRDLMEIITEGIKNHLVETKDYIFDWWDDREIDLGENWKIEIEKRVKESDVSILLISANFVSSQFIKINELGPLFHKYSSGKHLIIPVLARQYQYSQLEVLSGLQFFKTYYKDYGFSKPLEKNKLIPFDVLAEDKEPSDLFLNRYFNKLAEKILNSVTNKFK